MNTLNNFLNLSVIIGFSAFVIYVVDDAGLVDQITIWGDQSKAVLTILAGVAMSILGFVLVAK